jgi:putative oxidoreductase
MTTLRYHFLEDQRDAMILLARIMILAIYLYFGWTYLTDHATVLAYLRSVHAPVPEFTAIVATVIEFFGGLVLLFGFWTRPLAALFAVYTIGTGIIGHAFWNSTNPASSTSSRTSASRPASCSYARSGQANTRSTASKAPRLAGHERTMRRHRPFVHLPRIRSPT